MRPARCNRLRGDMDVVRLNANGTIDDSFDFDGRKEIDFGAAAFASAVAVQPDGGIVVAGTVDFGDMAVARLRSDGAFDPGFAGDGTTVVDAGGDDSGDAWRCSRTAGSSWPAPPRSTTTSWSRASTPTARPTARSAAATARPRLNFGGAEQATGVAVQPDGGIVVSGLTGGAGRMVVARVQGDPPPGPTPAPPGAPVAIRPPEG